VKLLSRSPAISGSSGPSSSLSVPGAGRIARPNRHAVFAGRGSSGTDCLSGGTTVGARESGGHSGPGTLGHLDGGPHGRGPGRMGGTRGQCGFGSGQMYYSQADLSAVKTAASTPWRLASGTSTNAGVQTFPGLGTNTPANAGLSQRDHSIQRDRMSALRGR
jgi:hypothetical protein